MTDDQPGSSSGRPPGGRSESGRARPRRAPVTLDQKPLSVTVEPAAEDAREAAAADPVAGPLPEPETPTEDARAAPVESSTTETSAADGPAVDVPASDPPPAEAAAENPSPEPQPEPLPEPQPEPFGDDRTEPPVAPAPQGRSGGLVVALLAGGIAGAAVATGLPFLLNTGSGVDGQRIAALEETVSTAASRTEVQAAVDAAAKSAQEAGGLNAAVAALEERIGQLAGRIEALPETPAGADAAAPAGALDDLRAEIARVGEGLAASGGDITDIRNEIADLGRRAEAFAGQIGGVEQTVASLDPERVREVVEERAGLNTRLAGLEETVRERLGGVDLGRLAAAADTQAGEIARLGTRITTAEGALTETERRVLAATSASDGRIVLVARLAVLERAAAALARGRAFQAEADTLARLGVDPSALVALSAAVGGLATPASLAPAFAASAAAFPVEEPPADAGIIDRLALSASRIVRIRPADGEPDASDVAGQVEAFLRRDDAEAALAAWRRLPEAARNQTAALGETLQRRIDAEAALAALTQAQVKALEALPAAGQGG